MLCDESKPEGSSLARMGLPHERQCLFRLTGPTALLHSAYPMMWWEILGLIVILCSWYVSWRLWKQRNAAVSICGQFEERLKSYRQVAVSTGGLSIATLEAKLEKAHELIQVYYKQQQAAETRYHASEQNAHRVQEICFREIQRLVREAQKSRVKLEVSPHITKAVDEYLTERGTDDALGGWGVPAPSPGGR